MSIQLKCPNGHVLKVKDLLAGQTVSCPGCQAPVVVPIQPAERWEEAILQLLGPPAAADWPAGPLEAPTEPAAGGAEVGPNLLRVAMPAGEMKVCPKCRRQVRACYDLCPHCQTYFTDLSEVRRRMASA